MTARYLVAIGVCLASGLPTATSAQATPAQAPQPARALEARLGADAPAASFRILALGSSSTQGVGATSPSATYPAQLEILFNERSRSRLPVSVVNRGIGGEDIEDMMRRLAAELQATHPNLVVWQIGSNDPLRGVPLDRFKAEVKNGIATIRAAGAEVMLMEPQWSPKLEAADASNRFVDAVRDIGADQHAEVVRRFDMMQKWMDEGIVSRRDLIGPDGLHMTDRGYGLLAKAVYAEIATESPGYRERAAPVTAQHNP